MVVPPLSTKVLATRATGCTRILLKVSINLSGGCQIYTYTDWHFGINLFCQFLDTVRSTKSRCAPKSQLFTQR